MKRASIAMPCPTCGSREVEVHDVAVVLAGSDDIRAGLLGWARAIVGSFRFDGLAIRITRAGRLCVTWPERRGHPTVIPIEPDIFRRVEAAVLEAYAKSRTGAGGTTTP